MARAGHSCGTLPSTSCRLLLDRRRDLPAQDVATLLGALETLGFYQPDVYESLLQHVAGELSSLPALNVSVCLSAATKARHYSPAFFPPALRAVQDSLDRAGEGASLAGAGAGGDQAAAAALANALYCCAVTGQAVAPFLPALSRVLQAAPGAFDLPQLCGSAWALAVAGHVDTDLLARLFAEVDKRDDLRRIDLEPYSRELTQLYQVQITLRDLMQSTPGMAADELQLPPPVYWRARNAWLAAARTPAKPSQLLLDVFQIASELGYFPHIQYLLPDGHFSVDISFQWRGKPVAVEVDGPFHFTATEPKKLLGSCLWKERCLRARGWGVIRVSFAEWEALDSRRAKQAHLLRLLQRNVLYSS